MPFESTNIIDVKENSLVKVNDADFLAKMKNEPLDSA